MGSARVRLDEVMDSPKWGTKQQLQLTGHKVDGVGTLLEVQLFLSTVSTAWWCVDVRNLCQPFQPSGGNA